MPTMITPREDHTATLLSNGKVLFAGGYDNDFNVLNTAELYDPVANFSLSDLIDDAASPVPMRLPRCCPMARC